MEPGDLPKFNDGATYMLSGETLNAIMNYLKEKTLVLSGDLKFDEVGPQGSKIKVNKIQLSVCIGGSPVTKTFLTVD